VTGQSVPVPVPAVRDHGTSRYEVRLYSPELNLV
jgi:hypothetical protein